MRFSVQLHLGFSLIILLAIAQGFVSLYLMRSLRNDVMHLSSEYTPEVILADAVRLEIAMAGYHMRACFTPPHPNDYRAGAARLETLNAVFPI